MGTKLYVGNLPFETTEDQLRETFGQIGEVVDVNIIADKYTGRSRGFGFVEMANQDLADHAVEKFNGSTIGGRDIIVNEARPVSKDRGGRGRDRDRGGYRGGRNSRHDKRDDRY